MHQYVRGHSCALPESLHLPMPYSTKNLTRSEKFKHWWFEQCTVSTSNSHSLLFLPSCSAYMKEVHRHYNVHRRTIHPLSKVAKYWDISMLITSLLNVLVYPLYCGFNSLVVVFPAVVYIALLLDFFCFVDIIFIFKTGYIDIKRRHIELDKEKIVKTYLKSTFCIHLLSCIPVQYLTTFVGLAHYYGGLFVAIKLYHLTRIFTYIDRFCSMNDVKPNVTTIFKTVLLFIIVTQWLTAFVHYIPEFNRTILLKTDTWFERLFDQRTSNFIFEYTVCFYHAMALAMNMSSGLKPPKTLRDLLIAFVVSLLGHFLVFSTFTTFTYLALSTMGTKFSDSEAASEIEEYMKYKMLSLPLQKRLKLFYNYRLTHNVNDGEVMDRLIPKELYEELKYHKNRQTLQQIPIFQRIPPELFEKLLPCLVEQIFLPGDIIIEENAEDTSMYCLLVGTVAIYIAAVGEICHMQKGAVFGECELLLRGLPRMSSVIALEVCVVAKLEGLEFAKYVATVNKELYKVIVYTALTELGANAEVGNKIRQLLEINKE